ncbi:type II secretion system F family protein [Pusillimonas sp. CC-YST705]|uniref:Type II secretion system F family protein n=1 Tax=Mesopusillimonas faecipullorum TaxID=2755040 RepID=A0ABS8CAZ6_9BURK|nr:type II secretion system F family protein [Mesopusillimonas faecipullorum]
MVFIAAASAGVWLALRTAKAYTGYRRQFTNTAQHGLREFFLFVDPAKLWIAQLWVCAGVGAIVWLLSRATGVTIAVMVLVLILPRFGLVALRRSRLARFERQLPDFLMSLAAALRAGSGLQIAVRHIVQQSPIPLAQEMGLMLQEQRMGLSFDEALLMLGRRVPGEGTALMVSALRVALHSGGNLSETLEKTAATLRSRLYMQGRIQALTSQGRMQAWVMALLPLLLAVVLDQLDPEAMALLWHTPMGWATLAVILLLEVCGMLLIRRIVAIDV